MEKWLEKGPAKEVSGFSLNKLINLEIQAIFFFLKKDDIAICN